MPKILLVEDEKDIVETIKLLLEVKGYQVCTAGDGITAMRLVEEERPDLILLDIVLPEMNGFQLCRYLKGEAKYRAIPIIMLTAKTPRADRFRGLETGADEYVTKPYHPEVLLEKIEKLLKDAEKR